jgi:hypothetical protein
MVPTPTVNDQVIQALEDERTVSYVPLLVLSEEVIFSLMGTSKSLLMGGYIVFKRRLT